MIVLVTFLMGVGYAAVNSVILSFNGQGNVIEQDGIYITETKYVSNVDADTYKSKINVVYGNKLDSNMVLSTTNSKSSITYAVTLYNSYNTDYYFDKVEYLLGNETYSNENIIFSLSGLESNQKLASKGSVTVNVTFSYKNTTLASSNILKFLLNFKFRNFACPTDGRVCDLSGNGNHGILNGAIMTKEDSIVYMDGVDDFVNCGLANYDFKNTVSYVIRFKINGYSSQNNFWEFFGNWQDAGGGLRVADDKKIGASMNINGTYVTLTTDKTIEINKWYTAVLTYDGYTLKIFIDGVLLSSLNSAGTTKSSAVPFYLGANPEKDGSTNYETNITIDYALLFDRTLTDNEATNDYYDRAILTNEKNLLFYYEFE